MQVDDLTNEAQNGGTGMTGSTPPAFNMPPRPQPETPQYNMPPAPAAQPQAAPSVAPTAAPNNVPPVPAAPTGQYNIPPLPITETPAQPQAAPSVAPAQQFNMPPLPAAETPVPVPTPVVETPAPVVEAPADDGPVIEIERGGDIYAEVKAEQKKKRDEKVGAVLKKAEGVGKRIKHVFHRIGFSFRHNRVVQFTALGILLLVLIGGGLGLYFALRPDPPAKKIWISFDRGDDVEVAPIEITVGENAFEMTDANGEPIVPTPLKIGSSFGGWSETVGGRTSVHTTAHLKNDTTLYAIWTQGDRMVILFVDNQQVGTVNVNANTGLNADELDAGWIIPTDAHPLNKQVTYNGRKEENPLYNPIIIENNYSDFNGWEYTDSRGNIVQLLLTRKESGNEWTYSRYSVNEISGEKTVLETYPIAPAEGGRNFMPPSYPTAMHAILTYRSVSIQFYDAATNQPLTGGFDYAGQEIELDDMWSLKLPSYNKFSNYDRDRNFLYWKIMYDMGQPNDANEIDGTIHWRIFNGVPSAQKAEFQALRDKEYGVGETVSLTPLWYYLSQQPEMKDNPYRIVFYAETADNTAEKTFGLRLFSEDQDGRVIEMPGLEDKESYPVYHDAVMIYLAVNEGVARYGYTTGNGERTESAGTLGGSLLIDTDFGGMGRIVIDIIYKSYERDLTAYFDYGADAIYLGDLGFTGYPPPTWKIGTKGGASILMPSGESFVNATETFYGWTLAGASQTFYYAGSHFTVPRNVTELRFVAVWRDPALMFQFNLGLEEGEEQDEGLWAPDTTGMKGDPGADAHITNDIPLRLGYDFVNWWIDLNGDAAQSAEEFFNPGDEVTVPTEVGFLVAQWAAKKITVNFQYRPYVGGNLGEMKLIPSAGFGAARTSAYAGDYSAYDWNFGGVKFNDGKSYAPPIPYYLTEPSSEKNDGSATDFAPYVDFKGWEAGGSVYNAGLADYYYAMYMATKDTTWQGDGPMEFINEKDGVQYSDAWWEFDRSFLIKMLGYDAAINVGANADLVINMAAFQLGKLVEIVYYIPPVQGAGGIGDLPKTGFLAEKREGNENNYDFYIPREDKFFDHKPWSNKFIPMKVGYEFIGWTNQEPKSNSTTPGGYDAGTNGIPQAPIINGDNFVELGDTKISLYPVYRKMNFTVEFRGSDNSNGGKGELFGYASGQYGDIYTISQQPGNSGLNAHAKNGRRIPLMRESAAITAHTPTQEFIGWSTDRDAIEGNPDKVYFPAPKNAPTDTVVQLSNTNNDTGNSNLDITVREFADNPGYAQYDPNTGLDDDGVFHLVFYAVFSTSSLTFTYDGGADSQFTEPNNKFTAEIFDGNTLVSSTKYAFATDDKRGYYFKVPGFSNIGSNSASVFAGAATGGWTVGPKFGGDNLSTAPDIIQNLTENPNNHELRDIDEATNRRVLYMYGIMVADDAYFSRPGFNFVGWKIVPPSGTPSATFMTKFPAGKVWFPGEYLPSVNFDLKFEAIWALAKKPADGGTINDIKQTAADVGLDASYNYTFVSISADTPVSLLKNIRAENNENLIIVLPRGYNGGIAVFNGLAGGAMRVTEIGTGKVARILLPSAGTFKMAAGSIVANSLREIYISDNLEGLNTPYVPNIIGVDEDGGADDITRLTVGGSLRRYVVRAGFWTVNGDNPGLVGPYERTAKYQYIIPRQGTDGSTNNIVSSYEPILANSLVVRANNTYTLLAVPSASAVGKNFVLREEIVAGQADRIGAIASYAFTNMKNMILVNFNDNDSNSSSEDLASGSTLKMGENAIYHSNLQTIVFPGTVSNLTNINAGVISGYQPKLVNVGFGPQGQLPGANRSIIGSFAFVSDGILYMKRTNSNDAASQVKVHIMYVLANVLNGDAWKDSSNIVKLGSADKHNEIMALQIPETVEIINDYALSSCINYTDGGEVLSAVTLSGEMHDEYGAEGLTFRVFGITPRNPNSVPWGNGAANLAKWHTFPIFIGGGDKQSALLQFYAGSEINNINELGIPGADYEFAFKFGYYNALAHTQTFIKKINIRKYKDGVPLTIYETDEDNITLYGFYEWEYGETVTLENPEILGAGSGMVFGKDRDGNDISVNFNRPFHDFGDWEITEWNVGNGFEFSSIAFIPNDYNENNGGTGFYYSGRKFTIGMQNTVEGGDTVDIMYVNSSITLVAEWDEYPVQFVVVDTANTTKEVTKWKELAPDFALQNLTNTGGISAPIGTTVTLSGLSKNPTGGSAVTSASLPALPEEDGYMFQLEEGGIWYKFIGWRALPRGYYAAGYIDGNGTYSGTYSWSQAGAEIDNYNPNNGGFAPPGRYFAELNAEISSSNPSGSLIPSFAYGNHQRGGENNNISPLVFYALYEASTGNFNTEQVENSNYYRVSGYNPSYETDIIIPYASYDSATGSMMPITEIAADVFAYNPLITGTISIGGAVLDIGSNAFRGTKAEELIFTQNEDDDVLADIKDSTDRTGLTIGDGAFAHSANLGGNIEKSDGITLPSITVEIGVSAFSNNYKVKRITLNQSTQYTGDEIIHNKYNLITIKDRAFAYCTDLVETNIGDSDLINKVAIMGGGVFMGSGNITNPIIRNYTNELNVESNELVHAGQTAKARRIEFTKIKIADIDIYEDSGVHYITINGEVLLLDGSNAQTVSPTPWADMTPEERMSAELNIQDLTAGALNLLMAVDNSGNFIIRDNTDFLNSQVVLHGGENGLGVLKTIRELTAADILAEMVGSAPFADQNVVILDDSSVWCGTDGVPLEMDTINAYAFSFAEYVNYIKIGAGIRVNTNAFYMLGEQVQYIDLTDVIDINNISYDGITDNAFSYMSFCPLYITNDNFTFDSKGTPTLKTTNGWYSNFANVRHWFRPVSQMTA